MQFRRTFLIATLVFFVSALLTIPNDYPHLAAEQLPSYLAGRAVVLAALVALLVALRFRARPQVLIPCWWVVHTFYVSHGQQFGPGYFLGYFEATMAVTFLFEMSKAMVRLLLGGAAVVFSLSLLASPAVYEPAARFKGDVLFGVVVVNAVGLLSHHFISSERFGRDEVYRRFAELGRFAAMLIHDIKGLIVTPILVSHELRRDLKDHPDERIQDALARMDEYLANLRELVQESAQLAAMNRPTGPCRVSDAVRRLERLLEPRLRGVKLSMEGDLELQSGDGVLVRVLLNVFSNSLDVFEEKRLPSPEIRIHCSAGQVRIEDNAGGYAKSTLARLKSGSQVTTRATGTGLGSLIVRDYMEALGGEARFANGESGAVVVLDFSRSGVLAREAVASGAGP